MGPTKAVLTTMGPVSLALKDLYSVWQLNIFYIGHFH